MEKKGLIIYLNEEENEKIEKAKTYSVLDFSSLCKVLIKKGLDDLNKSDELVFRFNKHKKLDKTHSKNKSIRVDGKLYQELETVCHATPFSMSALAKYFIMSQITEIIERKEFEYQP